MDYRLIDASTAAAERKLAAAYPDLFVLAEQPGFRPVLCSSYEEQGYGWSVRARALHVAAIAAAAEELAAAARSMRPSRRERARVAYAYARQTLIRFVREVSAR